MGTLAERLDNLERNRRFDALNEVLIQINLENLVKSLIEKRLKKQSLSEAQEE